MVLLPLILVPTVSKQTFLTALKEGEKKGKKGKVVEELEQEVVPFLRKDFALVAEKHWDQDDD